jgi:hypothetical protein
MKRPMKKILCAVFALSLVFTQFSFINRNSTGNPSVSYRSAPASKEFSIYESLGLGKLGLSKEAFIDAMKGYHYLLGSGKIRNDETVSIVDFSLPSTQKRLFVIDVKRGLVLFNTYVSHGRNSGSELATQFSNDPNSLKSSLGFYVTSDTYKGKHGYSLRLQGVEPSINDNAFSRGIVMHSAPYVNEQTIEKLGFLGRSEGCPAVPENLYKQIIAQIKNGSCLFMYSPDKNYLSHSTILNTASA